jgi:hypothetical protein
MTSSRQSASGASTANLYATIRERSRDGWIPDIYSRQVKTQRTRSYSLDVAPKENTAEIFHTLLGIELKVGKRRFACPDLATARYLRVFARIGCQEVAVPYDITQVSPLADALETAWQRSLLEIERCSREAGRSPERLRTAVMSAIRNELSEAGAGERMPAFRQSTKQRKA